MSVAVYDSAILNLKPGEDALPHLIFMGNYGDVICWLKSNFPSREERGGVIVKMYQPAFTDHEPICTSSWVNKPCQWLPGTMLPVAQ